MHVYSREMIISAAPIISIFEKVSMKNGMNLTWLKKKKNNNLYLNSSSVSTVVKMASPDARPRTHLDKM